MRKSKWISAALAVLSAASLTSGAAMAATKSTSAKASSFKVGLITDTGGINDHSFNYLAYKGLQMAEAKLGITGSVVQSKSESDYTPNLTTYAREGYNLVIAVGFLMAPQVETVSKEYPNTKFLIIDDAITDRKNVTGAIFKTEQSAYLAGALAGLMEQSKMKNINSDNVVGVVGGMQIPPVQEYIAGFQQGMHKTDPNGKVVVKWVGNFNDQAAGEQIAQSEISQGADIVLQLAGGAGVGVISAAKNANVYAMGADADQSYLAPANVVASPLKKVDNATFAVIQETLKGQFKSGVQYFDLKNGGCGIAFNKKLVPVSMITKVNQLGAQISAGMISVSPNMKQ